MGKIQNHEKAGTLKVNLGFIISWKKGIAWYKERRGELVCPTIVHFNGIWSSITFPVSILKMRITWSPSVFGTNRTLHRSLSSSSKSHSTSRLSAVLMIDTRYFRPPPITIFAFSPTRSRPSLWIRIRKFYSAKWIPPPTIYTLRKKIITIIWLSVRIKQYR